MNIAEKSLPPSILPKMRRLNGSKLHAAKRSAKSVARTVQGTMTPSGREAAYLLGRRVGAHLLVQDH